ncbi:MAG TPA: DUF4345 family protein [Burkholderiales bacterium]|nr:DUF4345 family protein [Burkholderiales bacterium]
MALLTRILFWGYLLMLVGVGASGIFIADWELSRVFHVPLSSMDALQRSTVLNQYGFLKSIEFAFGLFCVLCRDEIFRVPKFNRIFLVGVFGGVAARTLAILLNGVPHWAFVVFLALELTTGVLVLIKSRSSVAPL